MSGPKQLLLPPILYCLKIKVQVTGWEILINLFSLPIHKRQTEQSFGVYDAQ